jgi:transcriptional regulator with XRE-family HTH domain
MNIPERITILREQKGYSVNKLANLSGLSQGFVRQLELGEKKPTVDSLSLLCDVLDISLSDFFKDESNSDTVLLSKTLNGNTTNLSSKQFESLTAKKLKELRISKGLTTTELAKKCNLSQAVISKLENNNRIADVPTLSVICSILNISLSDFFKNETTSDTSELLKELTENITKLNAADLKALDQIVKTMNK